MVFFRALSLGPTSDREEPWLATFAGAALVSVWASLRFGNASHVRWSSLCDVSSHVVRGIAYRTKTTRRGMPFACQGRGIYGFWAATWLRSLDRLWLYLEDSALPLMRLAMGRRSLTWLSRRPMPPLFALCARSCLCRVALPQPQWAITHCIRPRQRLCPGHHSLGSRSSPDARTSPYLLRVCKTI